MQDFFVWHLSDFEGQMCQTNQNTDFIIELNSSGGFLFLELVKEIEFSWSWFNKGKLNKLALFISYCWVKKGYSTIIFTLLKFDNGSEGLTEPQL